MKILLLEDDLLEQFRFTKTIEQLGLEIEVVIANNGIEGMRILEEHKYSPSIILVDLNMPVQNGITFLENLQTKSELKLIPTIAFTTSSDQQDIDRCYELGIVSFLYKTKDPVKYRNTIIRIINH